MKKSIIMAIVGLAALVVAGCQTANPYTGQPQTSHTTRGALFGALGGAAIGALTNTSSGEQAAKNALIGAGIGALAGGAIGNYMDQQEAMLRSRLQATGVGIRRVGNDIVLVMPGDITFDLGSDQIRSEFYPVLTDVAFVLNEFNQSYVQVSGFTDTSGSFEYNMELSQRRANNVANFLISQQVYPQRLIVQGFGETNLAVPTRDGVQEPRNRRVEIRIVPLTS